MNEEISKLLKNTEITEKHYIKNIDELAKYLEEYKNNNTLTELEKFEIKDISTLTKNLDDVMSLQEDIYYFKKI